MSGLTKRLIDRTEPDPGGEIVLWDDDPRGFGVRIRSSGARTFFALYWSPLSGKKTRYTIGQYGRLTVEQARAEAKQVLGRVAKGEDPAREKRLGRKEVASKARTVGELATDYMRDAWAGLVTYRGKPKKASTLQIDQGRAERHIKPLLGNKLVADVTTADVTRFFHDVRQGKTAATVKTGPRGKARVTGGATTAARTVDLLGSIFSYAIRQELRNDNPVADFERPPTNKRQRVLSPDEYKRLGKALDQLEGEGANPIALAAIRFTALTGCRRGEVFSLRRDAVDHHRQCLRFADTKTGQQVRPVGTDALAVLESIPVREDNSYMFPAATGDGHIVGVKVIRSAVEAAGLEGVTLHTLRHSFASVALELEYSELTIAGLLGHRTHSITSRYAHHVDRALVAAADRVSGVIADRMKGKKTAGARVVPLRQKVIN